MAFKACLTMLHLNEIFPSISSVIIFVTYMIVCLQQALLVTASKSEDKTYPYNPATVVLFTECVKLVLALVFYANRYVFLACHIKSILSILIWLFSFIFKNKNHYYSFSNGNTLRGIKSFDENKRLMIYYMVPSVLYCIYNNLSFKNLSNFDPTTYLLLLQSRLLMTGVIYQV